jgi:hypothetical protein
LRVYYVSFACMGVHTWKHTHTFGETCGILRKTVQRRGLAGFCLCIMSLLRVYYVFFACVLCLFCVYGSIYMEPYMHIWCDVRHLVKDCPAQGTGRLLPVYYVSFAHGYIHTYLMRRVTSCIYIYIYIYISIYLSIYIYIYTHTYTHTQTHTCSQRPKSRGRRHRQARHF